MINVPSKLCASTQVMRRAQTRKLGSAHKMFLPEMFLHMYLTLRSTYRLIVVKCCTKEISCSHRL